MLRERIKALELRMTSMVHNAQDNRRLEDQLMLWIRDLLQAATPRPGPMAWPRAWPAFLAAGGGPGHLGVTAKKKASAWQVASRPPRGGPGR